MNRIESVSFGRLIFAVVLFFQLISGSHAASSNEERVQSWGGIWEFDGFDDGILIAMGDNVEFRGGFSLDIRFKYLRRQPNSQLFHLQLKDTTVSAYLQEGSYGLVVDFQGPDNRISRHRFGFPGISDTWHHLTICLRRNQLAIAYLDGRGGQAEQEMATHVLQTTRSRLNLGGTEEGDLTTFAGELDAVRFWNRMLDASEVALIGDRDNPDLRVQQLVDWTFDSDSLPSFVSQAFELGIKGNPAWKPGVVVGPEHTILHGKTVNLTDDPQPQCLIEMTMGGRGVVSLMSDADGDFLSLIPPGEEKVAYHAFDGNAHAFSGDINLASNQPDNPIVHLRLGELFNVEGFVRALDKATPVSGVEVLLSQPGNTLLAEGISVMSDLSGRYQFAGIPPGRYQLSARPLPVALFAKRDEVAQSPMLSREIYVDELSDRFDFEISSSKIGKWKHFGLKDGMPSNRVENIAFTGEGGIWLANRSQLYFFNGDDFTRISLQHEETIVMVSIAEDASGACWVACQDGRLLKVKASGEQQFFRSPEGAVANQLIVTDKRKLVAVTDKGLYQATMPQIYQEESLPLKWDILSSRRFNQILWEGDVPLWGATNHGLIRFEEGVEILYKADEGLSQAVVSSIGKPTDESVLFVQTAHSIYRLDEKGLQEMRLPDQFFFGLITCMAVRSRDELWLGTRGEGLWRWRNGYWMRYDMADGLPSEDISALELDEHGNVWVGTVNGFSRYNDRYWVGMGQKFGFQSTQHFSLGWDSEGDRLLVGSEWLGTTEVTVRGLRHLPLPGYARNILIRQGKPVTLLGNHLATQETSGQSVTEIVDGLPYSDWVLAGDYDPSGYLWAGRQWAGGGVMRFAPTDEGDVPLRFDGLWREAQGLPNEYVWCIWAEKDDRIWLGTDTGIYIKTSNDWVAVPHVNPKSPYRALDILQRKSGEVWVATQQGVGTVVEGRYHPLVTGTLLDDTGIWSLFEDSEERLWIGSNSNGLFLYHQEMMMHYTMDDWLTGNSIYDIAESSPGELWFANEYGVDRHCSEKETFTTFFKTVRADQVYIPSETLPSFELNTRLVLDFDVLDAACSDNRHLFRLEIRCSGSPEAEHQSLILTENRFEWVPERSGDYSLELTAYDADLHPSVPAVLRLNVVPPWYLDLALVVPMVLGTSAVLIWGLAMVVRGLRHRKESRLLRDQLLKQETSTRQNLEKVNQELKEARTIAEKAQKDAEIASEAKSLFLAKMSHEIRTPLNAVLGYSQLLKGNAMLNDQVSHGLSAIERSGQHLLKIINSILTLSKMESGHIQLQLEDFALSELIDTIQGMVAIPCQEKGLEYKIRCSEWAVDSLNGGHRMKSLRSAPPWPHLTFHSDLAKIRQVLLNLITNAVKFTNEGAVTMEIRVYHPKEAEDPFDKVPFELYFSVEDTGSGMLPEDRQRVFQAFEQGSQKGSGEHQGIGLGLAIAKRLVEVLGGNLSCDSTVGQGSLFSFTISIAPGHPEKIKDLLSSSKPRWKYAPPRALVVDDLEQNAKVLTRLLSLWGIPCEPVTSGEEAIEYLKNNRVEMVFMDIMMPKMSGTEAFKRIRQMLGPASPKCIAYSAHVLEHEQASYVRSSFDGFLAKPIQMEVLVQLIYTQFSNLIWSEADSQKAAEPRLDFSSLPESSMNELRSSVKRYAVTEIMRQIDHMESEGILDEHNCRTLRTLVRAGDMKRVLRAFD